MTRSCEQNKGNVQLNPSHTSFEEVIIHHKLHNIFKWSIDFVFWAEPKLPGPLAKL